MTIPNFIFYNLEPARGFEPVTCGLQNRCSTTELLGPNIQQVTILQMAPSYRGHIQNSLEQQVYAFSFQKSIIATT